MSRQNSLGQPIGAALPDWQPPARPSKTAMTGRFCRLEPLSEAHGDALWEAIEQDREGRIWTYMPVGPFADRAALGQWLSDAVTSPDPMFFAIIDADTAKAVGWASYLRIAPENGSIEVGYILFTPRLQRQPAATEAMYLMMRNVFDLGYRRYEWKCDALNAASRKAALRLGFVFEGIFRQATVYKGRNRDTAWFAVINGDWPGVKERFETWLAPENFDADGAQIRPLRG